MPQLTANGIAKLKETSLPFATTSPKHHNDKYGNKFHHSGKRITNENIICESQRIGHDDQSPIKGKSS